MIGDKPRDLNEHGRLLVRRAVHRDDWISEALLDIAAGDQTEWTTQEWDALLTELDACDMTIAEWLTFYA
jgi:hypothetical protein